MFTVRLFQTAGQVWKKARLKNSIVALFCRIHQLSLSVSCSTITAVMHRMS